MAEALDRDQRPSGRMRDVTRRLAQFIPTGGRAGEILPVAILIAGVAIGSPGLTKNQPNPPTGQSVAHLDRALAAVATAAAPPDQSTRPDDPDQGDDHANPRAILRVCSKDTPTAQRSAICPQGVFARLSLGSSPISFNLAASIAGLDLMSSSLPPAVDNGPSLALKRPMMERLSDLARTIKRDVIALWLAARDRRVPCYAKAAAAAVAAYALSPIDLISDFVPVLGYLDDLLIVPLGILVAVKLIPEPVMADLRFEADELRKPTSRAGLAAIVLTWLASVSLLAWLVSGNSTGDASVGFPNTDYNRPRLINLLGGAR